MDGGRQRKDSHTDTLTQLPLVIFLLAVLLLRVGLPARVTWCVGVVCAYWKYWRPFWLVLGAALQNVTGWWCLCRTEGWNVTQQKNREGMKEVSSSQELVSGRRAGAVKGKLKNVKIWRSQSRMGSRKWKDCRWLADLSCSFIFLLNCRPTLQNSQKVTFFMFVKILSYPLHWKQMKATCLQTCCKMCRLIEQLLTEVSPLVVRLITGQQSTPSNWRSVLWILGDWQLLVLIFFS